MVVTKIWTHTHTHTNTHTHTLAADERDWETEKDRKKKLKKRLGYFSCIPKYSWILNQDIQCCHFKTYQSVSKENYSTSFFGLLNTNNPRPIEKG